MAVAEQLGSEASANDEENHNDASTARAIDQSQVFFILFSDDVRYEQVK
jgi:hypothetical protein